MSKVAHMDLMSTAEAADRLDISIATLNRWAKNGAVPVAIQAPGRTGTRMFRREDIEALAEKRGAA